MAINWALFTTHQTKCKTLVVCRFNTLYTIQKILVVPKLSKIYDFVILIKLAFFWAITF